MATPPSYQQTVTARRHGRGRMWLRRPEGLTADRVPAARISTVLTSSVGGLDAYVDPSPGRRTSVLKIDVYGVEADGLVIAAWRRRGSPGASRSPERRSTRFANPARAGRPRGTFGTSVDPVPLAAASAPPLEPTGERGVSRCWTPRRTSSSWGISTARAYVMHACEHDHIDHWREAGAKLLNTSKRDAWVKQGDSQP